MSFFFLKNEEVSDWEQREGRTSGGVGRADRCLLGRGPSSLSEQLLEGRGKPFPGDTF